MLFTSDQINELLKQVDLQTTYLIGYNLGTDVLSPEQKELLKEFGIDIETVTIDYPPYLQAFLWGRLAVLLSEFQGRQVTYQNFMEYLKSVNFEPLTKREKTEYEIARKQTYHHIVSFGERVKSSVNDIIINEDNATRLEQERVLSGEIQRGILERKSLNKIVSNIGRRLNNWSKDWNKIVDTELQNIYNHGAAVRIVQKHGAEQLVYKDTYAGACRWCIRLHTTSGIGSEPITFTMNELYANGSNIGLSKDQWRATVSATHPFCRCNIRTVMDDQEWDKEKKRYITIARKPKVERKSKVKLRVGDKNFEI